MTVSEDMVRGWPPEGTEVLGRCPVCFSVNRELLYSGMRDRVFFSAPGEWRVQMCLDCKSAYLDPRPSADKIHLAYEKYYTHVLAQRSPSSDLSVVGKIRRSLANGYRNRRYGGDEMPSSQLGPFVLAMLPRSRQAIDAQLRCLPRLPSGGRVLDVGFGSGAFLDSAARVGWEVVGVDPDPVSVRNARNRGLTVYEGGVEVFEAERDRFDAVTISHVIEHVHAPSRVIEVIAQVLKPGGYLWLETPNIQAHGHAVFGRDWLALDVPRHLTVFSANALESLLSSQGFEDIRFVPRARLYPSQAAASRAIARGRDPFSEPQHRQVVDRAKGLISALRPKLSEFLTFTARKPLSRGV